MTAELTTVEADALAECEAVISKGLGTFVEVGRALLRIRDERLYRTTHGTFEDYCRATWSISASRARRMIEAAGVAVALQDQSVPIGTLPANEAQARELARVPAERRADVWRETVERTNGRPTAAAVRETFAPTPARPPLTREEVDELRVENLALPAPAQPGAGIEAETAHAQKTMEQVIEQRFPGSAAERARKALRARWSRLLSGTAEIATMNPAAVAEVLTENEVALARLASRNLEKFLNDVDKARRPGLRVVGATDD